MLSKEFRFLKIFLKYKVYFTTIGFVILLFGIIIVSPNRQVSYGSNPQKTEEETTPTPTFSSPTPTLVPTRILIPTVAKPKPTSAPKVVDGGKLFNLVNNYRAKQGLKPLLWTHSLCEYSKQRSQEIQQNWSHDGFDRDATSGDLYNKYCPDCVKTGENLAKGYTSEEGVLQGWINSPGHKANLEGDWDLGCSMYSANSYAAMIFGKKK